MDQRAKICEGIHSLIHMFKSNLDLIEVIDAGKWSNIGWHFQSKIHSGVGINYLVKGQAHVVQSGEPSTWLPGEVFLSNNYTGNHCENGSFNLFFCNFVVTDHNHAGKALYEKIQDELRKLPIILNLGIHDKILKLYIEMIKERSAKRFGYELNLNMLALQLLIELVRHIQWTPSNITPYQYKKYSDLVSDIIFYLQENTDINVNLQKLGDKYLLNPRYLNRIFKGSTGYPIFQYHQNVKVEKAKKLLSTSNFTVLQIALELGFENSQSFSKFYKKMTGHTPIEYRKWSK